MKSASSTPKAQWQYSSLPELPSYSNADRDYFIYHRDTVGPALRISAPVQSRLTGRTTIILSKRISKQDGSFAGVLIAAIDSDYFNSFYNRLQLGNGGAICLIRSDGIVLIRWPSSNIGADMSKSDAVRRSAQAQFGRILQDDLAVRRRHQIFRL